jgi:hypothetical protein
MRRTKYADQLATAVIGDARIERILVHATGQEEIRLPWEPDGKFMNRPLDLPEEEWLELVIAGMRNGVFTRQCMQNLVMATLQVLFEE